jgi:hypothetical protein
MKHMKTKDRRIRRSMLLAWLLLAPLAFSSCENRHPEMDITMETDFREIIAAINSANKSLSDKLALIEASLQQGLADNQAAMEQVRQAVASLSGTMEEKLAAVEAAVKAQTTSLETKLALVEAAVSNGFADSQAQQALLQQAIASLSGSMEERIALIEAAVKAQTTSLETKMGLIEAAVSEGFADAAEAQALILEAIASLGGTLDEKLAAIEAAIGDQTTALSARMALIETAVKEGFAADSTQRALIQTAVDSLGGTVDEKLAAIKSALASQTTSLDAKMALIEAAVAAIGEIGGEAEVELILQALSSLSGTVDQKLAAIQSALESQSTSLSSKVALIETAVTNGFADGQTAIGLLQTALGALKTQVGDMDDALAKDIDDVITDLGTLSATLTTGQISQALAQILAAVQGQTDYSQAMADIKKTIEYLEEVVQNFSLSYLGEASYTVVKGQTITVLLQVSPSSKTLEKEKMQIRVLETKQFFPTNSGTIADHFSLKSLVADPSTEGQYVATVTTDADEAVWDESTLDFVYNYGTDTEPEYYSTGSFQAVMLPRPVNGNKPCGVIPWKYPYASFCAVDSFFNAQGQLYPEDTLGVVYYALDKVTFQQKQGSESRTYTASNITSASFTPIDGNTAPVKCILDNEKHYVCFYPDTTNSKKWRDFQSSTGVKREDVAGILSLTDQWGVTSTYGVDMTWFNTYELNEVLNVSVTNDQSLVKGNVAYYPYNLTDKFLELGLDDDLMKDTRYGLLEMARPLSQQETGDGYENLEVNWKGSNREVDLIFNKPGNALAAGQKYRARGRFRLTVNPSDNTPNFTPTQVLLEYCITVNLTN